MSGTRPKPDQSKSEKPETRNLIQWVIGNPFSFGNSAIGFLSDFDWSGFGFFYPHFIAVTMTGGVTIGVTKNPA